MHSLTENKKYATRALLILLISFTLHACNSSHSNADDEQAANNIPYQVDTTYNNVLLNQQYFKVQVLHSKFDSTDEMLDLEDISYLIAFYRQRDGKLVFAKKFSGEFPALFKTSSTLADSGKLYLNLRTYMGGSGYTANTYCLNIQEEKITLNKVFASTEIDYILFHKNDAEILLLQGIWSNELDKNGDPTEWHYSEHKYKIIRYRFISNHFTEQVLGITKHKYTGIDEQKPATLVLQDMLKKESILPQSMDISNFKEFNNYQGEILKPE